MERDYGKEIDTLKQQIEKLQEMLERTLGESPIKTAEGIPAQPCGKKQDSVQVMKGMHPDSRLSELMEELCYQTEAKDTSGLVSYLGIYHSGGQQSNWIRHTVPTDGLLSLIESGIASKVLVCIGNPNRLSILLELLRGPKTVSALIEKCGFGSTGQVYHHLKPLLAADIVTENGQQKGVYAVQPHKVQGIIMLLAGISDMVDETYTQAAVWENSETDV